MSVQQEQVENNSNILSMEEIILSLRRENKDLLSQIEILKKSLEVKNEIKEETSKIINNVEHIEINKNDTDSDTPHNLLQNIGEAQYYKQEQSNPWIDSVFESINKLKNDYSGKVGELFAEKSSQLLELSSEYAEDKNSTDGTYDIKINEKKVEIKTARFGNQGAFQHENLKNDGCDLYMFIDIMPNKFYITVLPKFDLTKKCEIMGRTPHLRDETHGVYKFDFSEKNILKSIEKGKSIEINRSTTWDFVRKFFVKVF
jgi:hypothetical protein